MRAEFSLLVSCIEGGVFTTSATCEAPCRLLLLNPSVMFDSVRPHRRQPTRLPCPWDSPGKNTGVGCHFLLQCMKVKNESEVAQSCLTLRPHGLQPTRLLHPWDFPGKSTGVGCHCLLPLQATWCLLKHISKEHGGMPINLHF